MLWRHGVSTNCTFVRESRGCFSRRSEERRAWRSISETTRGWSTSRAIDGSARSEKFGGNLHTHRVHTYRSRLGVTRKRVGSCAQFTSNKRGPRDLPRTRSGETSSLGLEYARPRPRWAHLGFPSTTLHSCPDPLSSSTPIDPQHSFEISSRWREKVAARPLAKKSMRTRECVKHY